MIPIYLDPARARLALIGRGALAVRRLAWLDAAGATPEIWSDTPSAELAGYAGDRLRHGLPGAAAIASFHAVWIADLAEQESAYLAGLARAAGVLVNVEDVIAQCDFHTPAVVRRGRLTLAAGTGGASPAVARAARERLEASFPLQWARALEEIAQARADMRARNAGLDDLVVDARERLARHGLI